MKLEFRPKLLDTLPGYGRAAFVGDLSAGITVGVLALPLAMAFAIASGMSPTAGIWTAIVAGFLIAFLGGSRVQIGGPTGAFIPIIYAIVADLGVQNLLIATMMSGVLLFAMGALRLGNMIRSIPLSVVIGFYVIGNVHHALHTPLMSVTNAISGIIVVGALLQVGHDNLWVSVLAFLGILVASINVFGGFTVTGRMLEMFKREEPAR